MVDVIEFNKGKAMTLSRKHTLIIITLPAILLLSCQAVLRATSTPTAIPSPTPATVPTLPPADVQVEYGIGDPYFPDLGNPGYDVQNYVIALDVDPESGEISGKTTIEAAAKTDLSSFNLDFQGFEIGGL